MNLPVGMGDGPRGGHEQETLRGGYEQGNPVSCNMGSVMGSQWYRNEECAGLVLGSVAYNAFFFIWSAMKSLVRIERARIVHVGFLSA
jgi:hypothetical protein